MLMSCMSKHEVYVNPPVALVALEVKHPSSDQLTPAETRGIRQRLREYVPIAKNASAVNTIVVPGGQGSARVEPFTRLVDRSNTMAVSFRQEALVVETSTYLGWDVFRTVVAEAIKARLTEAPIEGVERVGLRYINEVRVPLASPHIDWTEWVQPQLCGPRSAADPLPLVRWQGVGLYGEQPGRMVIFRYGPIAEGSGLNLQIELRRRTPPTPGPFFLMDIDSFWTPDEDIPEANYDQLMSRCDEIHEPVSAIFENSVTDQLRGVFRQNA